MGQHMPFHLIPQHFFVGLNTHIIFYFNCSKIFILSGAQLKTQISSMNTIILCMYIMMIIYVDLSWYLILYITLYWNNIMHIIHALDKLNNMIWLWVGVGATPTLKTKPNQEKTSKHLCLYFFHSLVPKTHHTRCYH